MLAADPTGGPPNQPLFVPFLRMYLGVAQLQAGRTDESLPSSTPWPGPRSPCRCASAACGTARSAACCSATAPAPLRQLDELGGSPVYAQLARDLAARVRERLGS